MTTLFGLIVYRSSHMMNLRIAETSVATRNAVAVSSKNKARRRRHEKALVGDIKRVALVTSLVPGK